MIIVIATANINKVEEIRAKLRELGASHIELRDLGAYAAYVPPEENGATFAANARIKAVAAAAMSGYTALADDSGLMVEALGGAPGVYSARYAGCGHDDAVNNAKLLQELAGVPLERRQAAFHCSIAIARPTGEVLLAEGRVDGIILEQPRGRSGFGYDPLFYVTELGCGMAELSMEEKNRVSHRARALEAALPLLIVHPESNE